MKLPIYRINSFASGPLSGNPAAVRPLPDWIADDLLQSIAAETGLTTAFFVREDERWFTPDTEISGICGHGTLAAAFVAATEFNDNAEPIGFSAQGGRLEVSRRRGGMSVLAALDLLVVFPSADDVIAFSPDARGNDDIDFVSRWFRPKQGEGEDAGFTGSAHCSLVPYWAQQLARRSLRAPQPSPRGATVDCELRGDRVLLCCTAAKHMEGQIYL